MDNDLIGSSDEGDFCNTPEPLKNRGYHTSLAHGAIVKQVCSSKRKLDMTKAYFTYGLRFYVLIPKSHTTMGDNTWRFTCLYLSEAISLPRVYKMDTIGLKWQGEPTFVDTYNIGVPCMLCNLVIIIAPRAWLYYSHFIVKKVEAKKLCDLPKIKLSQGWNWNLSFFYTAFLKKDIVKYGQVKDKDKQPGKENNKSMQWKNIKAIYMDHRTRTLSILTPFPMCFIFDTPPSN